MARKSLLLYGDTDSYKTTQIGFLAKWLYKRTGKALFYCSADAGTWEPLEKHIEAGLIQPFSLLKLPANVDVRYILRKLTDGVTPTELDEYGQMTSTTLNFIDKSKYSGMAFEGLTSISELLLRQSAGKKVLQNASWSETIGDETFGGLSESHYGAAQEEIINLVIRSQGLPLEVVCWTGHELVSEDKQKRPVRGVAVVGVKGTPRIAKNVGTMIHCTKSLIGYEEDKVKGTKVAKYEPRYYFQSHPDMTMIDHPVFGDTLYPAKTRLPVEVIPKLLEKYKGGYFVPDVERGLDAFLEFEDSLEGQGNSILEWKRQIDETRKATEEGKLAVGVDIGKEVSNV